MNAIVRSPERNLGWDVFGEFDGLLNNFFRTTPVRRSVNYDTMAPVIDVSETDDAYKVRAELPGVDKEDLDVSINDGVLTISAESKFEHNEEKDGRVIRQERRYGKYARSMRLADNVDEDKVKAEYKDGILVLDLPKAEVVKPKKIEVAVA